VSTNLARVIPLRPAALRDATHRVFADVLSRAWPGFSARDAQATLTGAIADTLDGGGHLLAEGPCGVGKSLAYLIPAILRARATGRTVIVATASIALQEQLIAKDLPALNAALSESGGVTFALLKGRANYLCLHRVGSDPGFAVSPEERAELDVVDAWADTTRTGDRAELPMVVRDGVWNLRSTSTDECLRDGCEFYEDCHARAAKARAEGVNVLVVNQHLLCAHIAVHLEMHQDAVLPRTGPVGTPIAWDTVVIDEAHELGDVARDFLGAEITAGRIHGIARWLKNEGCDPDPLRRAADAFFADIDTRIPLDVRGNPEKVRVREGLHVADLLAATEAVRTEAKRVAARIAPRHKAGLATREETAQMRRAESAARRASRLVSWLEAADCPAESPDVVLWIERQARGPVLQGRHLEAGRILAGELWGRARSVIATSATMRTAGGWSWIRRQLGAPSDAREVVVPSPFDFARQARLCVPRGLPDPRTHREDFDRAVGDVTLQVARGALRRGGVLGLFTSRRMSDRVAAVLRAAGVPRVFAQGERSRHELIAAMREAPSVLCGTASMWTGVDLQGDAVVAVVIDKVPFAPPGDPVLDAVGEILAAATGDARAGFREESLPRAVLRMRQGAGRLIRAAGDRGVVVVCDSRMHSARYGRDVVASLGMPAQVPSVADAVAWLGGGA
jgi:ATP-dependent DNA helicase DinG